MVSVHSMAQMPPVDSKLQRRAARSGFSSCDDKNVFKNEGGLSNTPFKLHKELSQPSGKTLEHTPPAAV
jgi:hypothetical protein